MMGQMVKKYDLLKLDQLYPGVYCIPNKMTICSGMMGQMVKKYALLKLDQLYPGVYTEQNVVLSTTHTHSGPLTSTTV